MTKLKIYSFGCKYNKQYGFSVVIDTRILENPYYIPELKYLTGLDNRVYNFVISRSGEFLRVLINYLNYYLTKMFKIKGELDIGIMCTGGHHRSVSIARFLGDYYRSMHEVEIVHLDIHHEIS